MKCVGPIRQAITPSQIPSVLKEWSEPTYEEFRPRTAWSLFNAATAEICKRRPKTGTVKGSGENRYAHEN
jgi:hypothetical protein